MTVQTLDQNRTPCDEKNTPSVSLASVPSFVVGRRFKDVFFFEACGKSTNKKKKSNAKDMRPSGTM